MNARRSADDGPGDAGSAPRYWVDGPGGCPIAGPFDLWRVNHFVELGRVPDDTAKMFPALAPDAVTTIALATIEDGLTLDELLTEHAGLGPRDQLELAHNYFSEWRRTNPFVPGVEGAIPRRTDVGTAPEPPWAVPLDDSLPPYRPFDGPIAPAVARTLWKSLLANAEDLLADARVLLARRSNGRAAALLTVAQEEIGKAMIVYEAFREDWNTGDDTPRTVPGLWAPAHEHVARYLEDFVHGYRLYYFWSDHWWGAEPAEDPNDDWETREAKRTVKARVGARWADEVRLHGLHATIGPDDKTVRSPRDAPSGTIADDLTTAEEVVSMLLIEDHSRMKHHASTPYDGDAGFSVDHLLADEPESPEAVAEFERFVSWLTAHPSLPVDDDPAPTA